MVDRKQQSAARVRVQLERMRSSTELRHQGNALDARHRILSAWQSMRLSNTHRDFLDNPRFRPAMGFFLEELYGPKDFSSRDRDLERATPLMIRAMPPALLDTLAMALELHALSFELDHAMVGLLWEGDDNSREISEEAYARAYRALDNQAQREYQLELIRALGEHLDRAVSMPFAPSALRLARRPARLAGFGELQAFLEQGFSAFRHARGSRQFLETIIAREYQILRRLFAGHPRPFQLGATRRSSVPE